MDISQLITDPYNRRARLQPALLTIGPVLLVALLLHPDSQERLTTIFGVAAFFGGAIWLTQIGRDRGKAHEPKIFEGWGGKPSTTMLRHRDSRIGAASKRRYHAFLSHHVPYLQMPSADDEKQDTVAADAIYESACDWLIENTRDRIKFRLIFEENMNYGFRRNFWALRQYAIFIDLMLIAYVFGFFSWHWEGGLLTPFRELTIFFFLALAAPIVHLGLTLAIATKSWVRVVADSYAKQLLAACDSLGK